METSQDSKSASNFISDLIRYYMDFLETNFHKRRVPKRSVKYRDGKNLLIGQNLNKYPRFSEKLWKYINRSFDENTSLSVKRGQYKTTIPKSRIDLIHKQSDSITPEHVDQIQNGIIDVMNKVSIEHRDEADKAFNIALDETAEILGEVIIRPFLEKIEKLIAKQSNTEIDSTYSLEEVVDVLVTPMRDIISESINLLITNQEFDPKKELSTECEVRLLKDRLIHYFDDLSKDDLYSEIRDLVDNKHILDKQELYLYFCDIKFNQNRYPIFYIPISIEKQADTFSLNFDSSVFINKKAIEYIVQEYNNKKGKKGTLASIRERILNIEELRGNLPDLFQKILNEITDYFELASNIDLSGAEKQISKSFLIHASNAIHICIFDKSDESLVNDYEEMLTLLDSEDSSLAAIFNKIITNFIKERLQRCKNDIDKEWDVLPVSDKLVASSPIPLNSEQRQILNALNKDSCNYIAVEGPPGTGKSHTITALVFDYILKNKSVLVLSDKKEALDVVEDKITHTLNSVRLHKQFQNPILRLGKSGNTYNQILSTTSINNIRNHHKAFKKHYDELIPNIKSNRSYLIRQIEETIEIYKSINPDDLLEYTQLEKEQDNDNRWPIDAGEIASRADGLQDLMQLSENCLSLSELFDNESVSEFLTLLRKYKIDPETREPIIIFLKLIKSMREIIQSKEQEIAVLPLFRAMNQNVYSGLQDFIKKADEIKSSFWWSLFKRGQVKQVTSSFYDQFHTTGIESPLLSLDKIKEFCRVTENIVASMEGNIDFEAIGLDKYEASHQLLSDDHAAINTVEIEKIEAFISFIDKYVQEYPKTSKLLTITSADISTYHNNPLTTIDSKEFDILKRFIKWKNFFNRSFNSLPDFNYVEAKSALEKLYTSQMTHILDGRVLKFEEENRSTARTLKGNIRKKKRFPREEFSKLKEAFPCIIAGIRDFADYIPLEDNLFDLVIIDEASQVSIAQAFPALLRAKKAVILGDKKQFSNVKSMQARSDTNAKYLNLLNKSFKANVSVNISELERLTNFNIKTSVLEFFGFISNFDIMLLKHFRGYREHISYSSKHFYGGQLQAIRLRIHPINEVIKFTNIDHDGLKEVTENTNSPETEFIITELNKLKENDTQSSVGIITPHTNQQKLISAEISKLPDRDYFYDELNLKIMTFDTCQGEERDIIFYSMVATGDSDRLWGVFIKDLSTIDLEENGTIKTQRLNVGFSRAKECMHFVISKPIEEFTGSIGDALRHYNAILEKTKTLPTESDVDPKSPMETRVLEWLKNCPFYQEHFEAIEIKAQFPIGVYLKQLDQDYEHPSYEHPSYVIDFMFLFRDPTDSKDYKIIIEYDGLRNHLDNYENINEFNYEHFYTKEHVERQMVLESYGYQFIRLNRFNTGSDPIKSLNDKILNIVKKKTLKPRPHLQRNSLIPSAI